MSTRGLWGLRKNGHDIAVYHHFDCYPEGLGDSFVEFLKRNSNEKLSQLFDQIVEIEPDVAPTQEQKDYCRMMGWCSLDVASMSTTDWYCLLRNMQELENWQPVIDDGGTVYVDNYISFIKDSLFCEYAYIYDIDNKVLEFYEGWQKKPQKGHSRYGNKPNVDGYYPCRLAGSISKEGVDRADTKEIVDWMNNCLKGAENA